MATGCSAGGQQDVFYLGRGFSTGFPAQTDEISDIGLPYGWLQNTSDHPVRLLAVRFVSPPPSLHMLNVVAYRFADVHEGIISQAGVLPMECPSQFKPHPLSVVTVPPHADSAWLVILAFTISKPGVYHLNQVRIGYETQGHQGWQYQNINTTVTIKNPPLTNPTPLPSTAVCGS